MKVKALHGGGGGVVLGTRDANARYQDNGTFLGDHGARAKQLFSTVTGMGFMPRHCFCLFSFWVGVVKVHLMLQ